MGFYRSIADDRREVNSTAGDHRQGAVGLCPRRFSPLHGNLGGRARQFRYHMNGMPGTALEQACREEFWRYAYRSIMVFAMAVYRFRGGKGLRQDLGIRGLVSAVQARQ